jgi:hypothetical protein
MATALNLRRGGLLRDHDSGVALHALLSVLLMLFYCPLFGLL